MVCLITWKSGAQKNGLSKAEFATYSACQLPNNASRMMITTTTNVVAEKCKSTIVAVIIDNIKMHGFRNIT